MEDRASISESLTFIKYGNKKHPLSNRDPTRKNSSDNEIIKLLEKSKEKDGKPNVSLHYIEEEPRDISEQSRARKMNSFYESKVKTGGLHIACKSGEKHMCKYLINRYPAMLFQVDNDGWNAALCAAQGGNVEILELLAENGVDLKYKNRIDSDIFHIACMNSRLEMCQHIIQHYPEMLKQLNAKGWNAAFCAAHAGNIQILQLLAEKGVDMTHKNKNGSNILNVACSNSKLKMCQHIIQYYPNMLKQEDDEGWNAALYAAQGGNIEILQLLGGKGVDMTHKNKYGSNILHIACSNCKLEICQHTIQHYPDMLHQVDYNGWNAALYAAQGGNVEILKLLTEKGVDITCKNKNNVNILHLACSNSKLEMCQHIIQHYPDILKQEDYEGWNAASYATVSGNVIILEILAEKGVNIKQKNKRGRNILHIACVNSRLEMCQHIIKHYPNMLKQVDYEGWNAALCAAQGERVEILELLEEKGVDMTHKNKFDNNILYIACVNSTLEVCRYIIKYHPDMLYQVDCAGWNSAMCTAFGGNVEILELLAEKGVTIKHKNKVDGNLFHVACMNSNLEMCKHITQYYPDMLQQMNTAGWNAAFSAARGGNIEILELLEEKGVDITHNNKLGSNILHIACAGAKSEMCQHIIKHYPDMLQQVNNRGWNAALFAAQGGNVEILELLAENGVDMTHKTKFGVNILQVACSYSKIKMCQHIIQHYPDLLKEVHTEGSNAIICAAIGGNVEILRILAEKGVDTTHKNKVGSNILHVACLYSKLEMCQYIIQHYPEMLKQINDEGWNATLCAAQGGNVEILDFLAENVVDTTHKNKYRSNILHIACSNSKSEMCQHIIQHYPDMLKQINAQGWNAAIFAAFGGNVKILQLLAKKGVSMTHKSRLGENILHIACKHSHIEMCKHIIHYYPDMLNQVDYNGWNVALCAAQGGNVEILELLAEKGVDMTHKNKDGCNILHIA
ncbi:ankyrin-2-like, partial [Saccostrea cucullata]|uniref:ankyrin-2-like n=1 Tax=Saccostrea cuccullata TaxID=36930 RepID=UPI002ED607D4